MLQCPQVAAELGSETQRVGTVAGRKLIAKQKQQVIIKLKS